MQNCDSSSFEAEFDSLAGEVARTREFAKQLGDDEDHRMDGHGTGVNQG